MNWRIYRLPGSKGFWILDYGPNSPYVWIQGFATDLPSRSVSVSTAHPRAWIQIDNAQVFIDGQDIARFTA